MTQRKAVDYLRARRGPALARGDYSIEVVEGRSVEVVSPEKPAASGSRFRLVRPCGGCIESALYVSPPGARRRRRVAVVGRAGTTIVDDIAEIEEFASPPWDSGQVTDEVVFAALQHTAGRRGPSA